MVSEREYNIILGKLISDNMDSTDRTNLMTVLNKFEAILDDADENDAFGTDGWRYHMGWSE